MSDLFKKMMQGKQQMIIEEDEDSYDKEEGMMEMEEHDTV